MAFAIILDAFSGKNIEAALSLDFRANIANDKTAIDRHTILRACFAPERRDIDAPRYTEFIRCP
ncbi:hypothetical protein V4890_09795 [Ralstonia solanacearum species complex bacterium KE056]|uniref:hypothetical protein n=1 Tax=Ralstonia solanacearum species complex bacterium KE056 TaxID=3119585 RepID=UPI002FC3960C